MHTFCRHLLRPEEYFDTHPEYFAEIGGKRIREKTQLCLTNPDVLRLVTEQVLEDIRSQPDARIFSLSQDDNYNAQRYAPGYYTHPDGYTEYLVTKEFYDLMKSNPDDIRSELVGYRQGKGPEGPYPLKYPGKTGSSVPLYSHSVKVVRLAEMYLIAAEAALKTSGASAAVPYLNTLRQTRIANYQDATTTDIDDILLERRKELFSEGQIAFDFWRNGKSVKSGIATYGPDHYQNVLPIPKDEIDICGEDVLQQNPGY